MNYLTADELVLALSRELELALTGTSETRRSWPSDRTVLHQLLLKLLNSEDARRLAEVQLAILQGRPKLVVALDGKARNGAGTHAKLSSAVNDGRRSLLQPAWLQGATSQEIQTALPPGLIQSIKRCCFPAVACEVDWFFWTGPIVNL